MAGNQVTNLEPIAKMNWLTTLDITGNQVESLQAITTLRDLDMLLMSRNKVTDLAPLVDMCRKDAEGDRRFAPYLEVYLGENPIDEKKKVRTDRRTRVPRRGRLRQVALLWRPHGLIAASAALSLRCRVTAAIKMVSRNR